MENNIAYVRGNAPVGRSFGTVADLNQALFQWEANVADRRIHGTTKRQVAEHFKTEKPSLLPLPSTLFPCFQDGKRTVQCDAYVEVAKAFYHVPPEYLRRGSGSATMAGADLRAPERHDPHTHPDPPATGARSVQPGPWSGRRLRDVKTLLESREDPDPDRFS